MQLPGTDTSRQDGTARVPASAPGDDRLRRALHALLCRLGDELADAELMLGERLDAFVFTTLGWAASAVVACPPRDAAALDGIWRDVETRAVALRQSFAPPAEDARNADVAVRATWIAQMHVRRLARLAARLGVDDAARMQAALEALTGFRDASEAELAVRLAPLV